ncbi:MAG: DHHA1 domain-containing protein [Gemmatimonadota bacterium]
MAAGLYAAIVTDTGSFRFANTTPRTHAIAGELVRRGVDPEEMYRQIYATVPLRQLHVLRAALDNLDVDPELPISWVSIPRDLVKEFDVTADDLDGVVEYPRSIEGTEVALIFRETVEGGTKISLRSNGAVDVNAIARRFGGGGHVKAAGAVVGKPLAAARDAVLAEVRDAVRALENRSQHS